MRYYKIIENEVITMIGSGSTIHETQTEITKEEYDSLMLIIQNKPIDTFESVYKLKESGIYEPRERTEEEKIDWFVEVVSLGTVKPEEVPVEYRAEVENRLSQSEPDAEQVFIDAIIASVLAD